MCPVLRLNRNTYYYEAEQKPDETQLTSEITEIFQASHNNYGTRKIKKRLEKQEKQVFRRRTGRIMKQEGQAYRNVAISDLTYVRAGKEWNCICILADLFNQKIIGCSAGRHKTAGLVKKTFQSVKGSLRDICLFHTDRGNEFKNKTVEELLEASDMKRSLSHKGCPYDNAVAEATFKIIKTEFVGNETFRDLKELKLKDYVNWYNHYRPHSSLGYLSPVEYRENNLKIVV